MDWVQRKKYTIKSIADLDRSLCDFFSELCYLRQLGPGKAQNCRAAILHFCPEWENSLPLSRRALKGYRKLELGQEGEGFSEEVWGLLLQDLNHHSPVAFAILALSLDGYLRGMDWDAMRPDDVSVGIVAGQKRVSIRLGVRERGEATKTGSNKGLVVNREWVAVTIAVLAQQRAAGGHSRLFALSRPEFDATWKSALQRLNLQWIDTPHAIRHAGATIDHLVYSVSLPEVQKRGRWDCLKSVTRYSKPDILVRGNSRVPTEQLKRGELYLAFLRERLTFVTESHKLTGRHKKRRFN